MSSHAPISIWNYLDYRRYLQDYFTHMKTRDAGFSNHVFCVKAGMDLTNSSLVSKVLMGKRKLSQTLRFKFAMGLGLDQKEAAYFDLLVEFCHARDMAVKNRLFAQLKSLREKERKLMEEAQYLIHKKWYYHVVRAYFGMHQDRSDPNAIAADIYPPLKKEQVDEAIGVLLGLRLIRKTANGYCVADGHLTARRGKKDPLGKNLISEMTRLGLDVFHDVPASRREFNFMTMYMSEKCFANIKERIKSFREEIRTLLDSDKDERLIYTLAMQFFPNTAWRKATD